MSATMSFFLSRGAPERSGLATGWRAIMATWPWWSTNRSTPTMRRAGRCARPTSTPWRGNFRWLHTSLSTSVRCSPPTGTISRPAGACTRGFRGSSGATRGKSVWCISPVTRFASLVPWKHTAFTTPSCAMTATHATPNSNPPMPALNTLTISSAWGVCAPSKSAYTDGWR